MKYHLPLLGTICLVGASAIGQETQASRPALPPSIQQCDHVLGNTNCSVWTSDGAGGYNGRWDHGEVSHIAVGSFDGQTVQFLRKDAAGKYLQSTYTGRIVDNDILDGVIAWKVFGHEFKATWTGKLLYPAATPVARPPLPVMPQPSSTATFQSSPQGGGLAPAPPRIAPATKAPPDMDPAAIAALTNLPITDTAAMRAQARQQASSGASPLSDQDIQAAVRAQQANDAPAAAAAKAQVEANHQKMLDILAQRAAAEKASAPPSPKPMLKVAGGEMRLGHLIETVPAVYPIDARVLLQGESVVLAVTVAKDGSVKDIRWKPGPNRPADVFLESAMKPPVSIATNPTR